MISALEDSVVADCMLEAVSPGDVGAAAELPGGVDDSSIGTTVRGISVEDVAAAGATPGVMVLGEEAEFRLSLNNVPGVVDGASPELPTELSSCKSTKTQGRERERDKPAGCRRNEGGFAGTGYILPPFHSSRCC